MSSESVLRPAQWQARLPFFYGWVIVGIALVMGFFSLGLSFVASLLLPSMQAEVGWSRSGVLGAVAVRGLMGIVISPIVGHMADRRHGAMMLSIIGGIASSIGLALVALADAEWQFFISFGVIGGLATVMQAFIIGMAIVPKWFIRLRGLTGALTTFGGAASAVVMPLLVPALQESYGWRGTWVALAILAFLLTTIPSLLLVRQPEDIGLAPDGAPVHTPSSRISTPASRDHNISAHVVLASPGFWLLVLGTSMGMLSQTALPTNMTLLLADRGFSPEGAALGLTAFGIGSMSVKLPVGFLSTRFPLRRMIVATSLYTAACVPVLFLLSPAELGHAFIYGLLIGTSIGGFVGIVGPVFAEYYGRHQLGRISGVSRPFGIVASWGGVWLMALSADLLGSYDVSLWVISLGLVICAMTVFWIRPPRA